MATATATKKLTREEMIEKLMSLHEGVKVHTEGKTWQVVYIHDCGGKLCRRDVGLLEEGKPATYMVAGKYLAAGQMLEFSNVQHRTLYAQKACMDFEVVA